MKNTKTKQKPKYRTQDNYVPGASSYEYNSGELLTVPNLAITIPEILERFTRGFALPIKHDGQFTETDDFDDDDILRRPDFDIVDIHPELEKLNITKSGKTPPDLNQPNITPSSSITPQAENNTPT